MRSEISRRVRLAMSWTSCWILGGYSLGALSRGAPARASLLLWLLLLNCRAAQTPGTCCLAPHANRHQTREKERRGDQRAQRVHVLSPPPMGPEFTSRG